jgi:hypothetical protein
MQYLQPVPSEIQVLLLDSRYRRSSQRPDCVADDAVGCELVSAPNSLLTGKLTGNFADSCSLQRFWRVVSERIQ